MEIIEKRTCAFCNKTLKTIGFLRKNGKNHPDWEKRNLHKKCWKLKMKQIIDNYYETKFKENDLNNISLVSI